MIRLNCIVEGQTELGFISDVLKPHLAARQVFAFSRCVETSRKRGRVWRGGTVKYERFKRDLTRWMKEDQNPDARFTTMVDLYAISGDFPGYEKAELQSDPSGRVELLEQHLAEDIGDRRLVPYIQLHEFEALLFCDPSPFEGLFVGCRQAVEELAQIASQFASPELINDGEHTAPSKRIIQHIPQYAKQKVFAGPLIAEDIGLAAIRDKCPHFRRWIEKLEALDQ